MTQKPESIPTAEELRVLFDMVLQIASQADDLIKYTMTHHPQTVAEDPKLVLDLMDYLKKRADLNLEMDRLYKKYQPDPDYGPGS